MKLKTIISKNILFIQLICITVSILYLTDKSNLYSVSVQIPSWKIAAFVERYDVQAARNREFTSDLREISVIVDDEMKKKMGANQGGRINAMMDLDSGIWYLRIRGVGNVMKGDFSNIKTFVVQTPRLYGNILLANYYLYLASNYYFTSKNEQEAYRFVKMAKFYSPAYYPNLFQGNFVQVVMKDENGLEVDFLLARPETFVLDRDVVEMRDSYLKNINKYISYGHYGKALQLAKSVLVIDPFDKRVQMVGNFFLLSIDPNLLAVQIEPDLIFPSDVVPHSSHMIRTSMD